MDMERFKASNEIISALNHSSRGGLIFEEYVVI
jgi:hypothetical protein